MSDTYTVDELVVTGTNSQSVHYRDFAKAQRATELARPITQEGAPGSRMYHDSTPDTPAEWDLALRFKMIEAKQLLLSQPDQSVEQSVILYVVNGSINLGVVSAGTPIDGVLDVTGIVDQASIIGFMHTHVIDDRQYPGAQDWNAFDTYYANSAYKDHFQQIIVNGNIGYMYETGDRDMTTPGPRLWNPAHPKPIGGNSPSEELTLTMKQSDNALPLFDNHGVQPTHLQVSWAIA